MVRGLTSPFFPTHVALAVNEHSSHMFSHCLLIPNHGQQQKEHHSTARLSYPNCVCVKIMPWLKFSLNLNKPITLKKYLTVKSFHVSPLQSDLFPVFLHLIYPTHKETYKMDRTYSTNSMYSCVCFISILICQP